MKTMMLNADAAKDRQAAARHDTMRVTPRIMADNGRTGPVPLASAIGNLTTQRLLRAGEIQPKLSISSPGDPYEQEADRMADNVMNGTIHRSCAACAAGAPSCPGCEEDQKIHPKP